MQSSFQTKLVGIVIIVIAAGLVIFAKYNVPASGGVNNTGGNSSSVETTNPNASSTNDSTNTSGTGTTAGTYTLADVAKHTDATSCWTTINGGVYDVTAWIDQHPGGREAILGLCGKDGSAAFNGQHGGQRRPASELASFKIGVLK